jgi:RNA polymerase sigma-70 factor (ECF subfamily)
MASPAERTDAQVVRDVLAGDRDAYRLLVRRYGDVLFGHAVRVVGSRDEAADLVQKALVKGYRKLRACRDPERVGAWLFRILANSCKDHLRAQRPSVRLEDAGEIPGTGPDPLAAVESSETLGGLRKALGRLTPEQREAFVLKHVEGRSYEEMAAVLDLSVASLKMRVRRAREALQGLMEGYR